MSCNNDAVLWAALPEDQLLAEWHEGGVLVYSALSNETHFLNNTAAEILRLLQTEPMTLAGVIAGICSRFRTEETPALIREISGVVQEFERLELICPASA